MRDYSVVTPAFWIGETGKKFRGDLEAQLLAVYLITSPHSTMTGVFHCPILYMSHETGIPFEGASKALARLIEAGFCEYEDATETVFVVRMACFQIADHLKPGDNRIVGLKKDVSKMGSSHMRARFLATHSEAFCLNPEAGKTKPLASPFEAPPKPGTGTGTGTGGEGLGAPLTDSDESPPPSDPGKQNPAAKQNPAVPSMAGAICVALKSIGMGAVNPGNLNLKALIDAGADIGMFVEIGRDCVAKGKPFSYLLAAVKGRIDDSSAIAEKAISIGQTSVGILAGAI